jgi:hypothetical protein
MLGELELAAGVLDSEVINNHIEEDETCAKIPGVCFAGIEPEVWYGRGEVVSNAAAPT